MNKGSARQVGATDAEVAAGRAGYTILLWPDTRPLQVRSAFRYFFCTKESAPGALVGAKGGDDKLVVNFKYAFAGSAPALLTQAPTVKVGLAILVVQEASL